MNNWNQADYDQAAQSWRQARALITSGYYDPEGEVLQSFKNKWNNRTRYTWADVVTAIFILGVLVTFSIVYGS